MKNSKRVAALVCAAVMTVGLTACGSKNTAKTEETAAPETVEETAVANPMAEVASLEELNEAVGSQFYRIDETVLDESFYIIDDGTEAPIGQYTFTWEGHEYTARFCADTNKAITGIYSNGAEVFGEPGMDGWEAFSTAQTDDCYCAHWCTPYGQYSMSADVDENLGIDGFTITAFEYVNTTTPANEADATADEMTDGTGADEAAGEADAENEMDMTGEEELPADMLGENTMTDVVAG